MPTLLHPSPCLALRPALAVLAATLACGAAAASSVQVQVSDAAGKPLAGAVVFADSPAARAALKPVSGAAIVQRERQFQPQVSVVTVGTAVHFPNEDTVRHHVYSFSPVKKFEIKLYVGTPAAPVVFDKPGIAVLGCNIHDQMAAWVLVLETPYSARTGADGQATLAQLPPGSYTLRAWHPELPAGAPAAEQALNVAGTPLRAAFKLGRGL
ncbi:methylamine utilization protein [Aquabacterium sp. OR-4]|uniref:methylamine utilization protein n=1 Tax=Aquabacterium sp. OR-4 TaxID=2978127 RepID=UPI0021B32473|nr:methylamine utilization protein [Aquabacterium sp. OR-4]MDT7833990.1 methylamine utilization protein [Aquabacterium sp. OR-4]